MAEVPCLWWDEETGKIYSLSSGGNKIEYIIREYDDGTVLIQKNIEDDINSQIYRDYFIEG